jgi:predicted RNase H-like HicB family nuclease
MARIKFTVMITHEDDGSYWASVEELPGCFASGHTFDELQEALSEAIQMCLPEGITIDEVLSLEKVSDTQALVYA